ncbi:DUF6233 domain-containing protein [Streptomyces sp. NPDC001633]|uniref:DUF6233 domain-containing protein n=1 Tax=Streptomyces sp. NPDC001633 TaxID=3364595 RepID=UPI003690F29B
MNEQLLPSDPYLLRIIERYLVLQLTAVRRRLAQSGGSGVSQAGGDVHAQGGRVESTGARSARPAPEWVLQLGIGARRQPVAVHCGGCAAARGSVVPVSRRDALEALAGGVEPCFACRPDRELQVD